MNSDLYFKKIKSKYKFLFNIAHFDNVKSIINNGLFCYNLASSIKHTSVANPKIQANRARKKVPNGLMLHEYANLYFNGRNAMMYRMQDIYDSIALICVDLAVLDLPGCVVSDMNAAVNEVAFYSPNRGINCLNFNDIFCNWYSDNELERNWLRCRVCAEVLVPKLIDPKYIKCIIVRDDISKAKLQQIIGNLSVPIVVDKNLFFNR